MRFSDRDFICGEAEIKDGCEEDEAKNEDVEGVWCSDCPYFCPVCEECMYEGKDERHVLPSTEFGYPSADGNKIRLLGVTAPNTPQKRPPPERGRRKGVLRMKDTIFFMLGTMLGGMCGVACMCVLQINRLYEGKEEDDAEKERADTFSSDRGRS